MPLSKKYKRAIEVIYLENKWSVSRILKEFPSKDWKLLTVRDLLEKIDETENSGFFFGPPGIISEHKQVL